MVPVGDKLDTGVGPARVARTCRQVAQYTTGVNDGQEGLVIGQETLANASSNVIPFAQRLHQETSSRLEVEIMNWPRNQSTGKGGGLSTLPGGGLYTGSNGGASTSRGGGLSSLEGGGLSTAEGGGLSTGRGGGLSTLPGGGLSELEGGGLSTQLGGGLSTLEGGGMSASAIDPYTSNIPPWTVFIEELEKRGMYRYVALIKAHLPA